MDLAEASEDEIFKKLTANATSTNHQDARLVRSSISRAPVQLEADQPA